MSNPILYRHSHVYVSLTLQIPFLTLMYIHEFNESDWRSALSRFTPTIFTISDHNNCPWTEVSWEIMLAWSVHLFIILTPHGAPQSHPLLSIFSGLQSHAHASKIYDKVEVEYGHCKWLNIRSLTFNLSSKRKLRRGQALSQSSAI